MYGTNDGRTVAIKVGNFYGVSGKSTVTVKDPTLKSGKTEVIDKGQTGKSLKTTYVVTAQRPGHPLTDLHQLLADVPDADRVGTATTSST